MDTTIDPTVKALTQAIKKNETGEGDTYNTPQGPDGELGAYRFIPSTWQKYAAETLGDSNAPMSVENQNKVAYSKVKKWKDAGYNPAQIASMWNAGEGAPNAYKENHVGTSSAGVHYDTPQYAARVSQDYLKYKEAGMGQGSQSSVMTSTTPDIDAQKQDLKSQGQPVSVQEDRAQPTLAGSAIRGLLTPFAQVGTSLAHIGQTLAGKPTTDPFSGSYLGKVEQVGGDQGADITKNPFSKDNLKTVKSSVGTGIDVGLNLVGGSEAEAGLKAVQTGGKFIKPLASQIGRGVLEGAGIGAGSGIASGLSKDDNLTDTLKSGLSGGIFGGLTGGLLGTAGGLLSKAKGITPETETIVKNALNKDYLESLSGTVSGRKALAENAQGMADSLESGILPDVKNGRYDVTRASNKLQDLMDQLGSARGADIISQNKPVDINAVRSTVMGNISKYVQDPLEREKVSAIAEKWFDALGDKTDLKSLNTKQVAAGKLAKFENQSDATVRNAYRNIYHGLGEFINNSVADSGGINKKVNETLTKYHGVMNFLDSIHEKTVKDSGLVSMLSSHAAKTVAAGLGGTFGGGVGAVVASEGVPMIERVVRGIFGTDTAGYQKVMDKIVSGEQNKINEVLKQVEKNKGTQAMREVQRVLEEVKQLPAPSPGEKLRSQVYAPIQVGGASEIEKPASVIRRHDTAPKEGLIQSTLRKKKALYTPYDENLPSIDFGKPGISKKKAHIKGLPIIR